MAIFNRESEIKRIIKKMDDLSPPELLELVQECYRLRGERYRLAEIEEFRQSSK